ncbi:MAG TPA: hypothetical protein PLU07_10410 [Ferruginibacter sp.]|nr:hypothetical protein [Ferruginibacter sp.]HUN02976.1 hypothetical protein [Niabella sp.]
MIKINPTYELKNDSDLSKFLLGAIRDVRKNELDVEKATVISQLADKYTKNEIMRCLKAKITKQNDALNVDAEINKALMEKVGNDEL